MQIRNYKDADFPQLKELLKATGIYYEPLDKREIFQKKIEHDPASIIIAEDTGGIIGIVFIIYDPWNSFVYHLGVHPDCRGKGLANELMDEAEGRQEALQGQHCLLKSRIKKLLSSTGKGDGLFCTGCTAWKSNFRILVNSIKGHIKNNRQ